VKLVVGAPVYERGWILERWFERLTEAIDHVGPDEVCMVLNYAPGTDDTYEIIGRWGTFFDEMQLVHDLGNDHHAHPDGYRNWSLDRYRTMSRLRNRLLLEVRQLEPDFYLSCDTDMLLQKNTISKLLAGINDYDAIAPLAFMTPKTVAYPNAMQRDFFSRPPLPEPLWGPVIPVAVCFGTVLMKPSLYSQIDYVEDPLGEDIGWGKRAVEAGLTMALHTGAPIKHVMSPKALREVDDRVGY
jgi:hypothetical protein